MPRKSLTALFEGAYNSVAARQNTKYGNPIGTPPTEQVVPRLEALVDQNLITEEQARKAATKLGRTAYGEYGLTHGRVLADAEQALGVNNLPWNGVYQAFCEMCS